MITNYSNYITEFKSEDIKLILGELRDYFTIGFEIELELDKNLVKGLKSARNESILMYLSIKNKKLMADFKQSFPNFWDKYKDIIIFHEDETIVHGIEIVNDKFNNIKDAIEYIDTFFLDYEDQKRWGFSHRTSIHVNIGTHLDKKINIVKGVIMISDQEKGGFVFKGIENRIKTFCSSMKEKLLSTLKKEKNYKLQNTTNVDVIERMLDMYIDDIYDFYGGVKAKHGAAKLFGLIPKGKYVEFRYVGGENLNEKMMKDKIIYFCYLVYLMTSDYRNKEYVRKLFSFINKLRTE